MEKSKCFSSIRNFNQKSTSFRFIIDVRLGSKYASVSIGGKYIYIGIRYKEYGICS